MKLLITAAILFMGAGTVAIGAPKADFGKREYDSKCAVCHGLKGKGDGPYAGLGTQIIPDLTGLARRSGGTFPFQKVYDVIEGSVETRAHGTREMPIWGREYRLAAGEAYFDVSYDPEAYVRTRVLALAEYVNRLQAK